GILTAAGYFTAASSKETELRKLAEILYRRVDWQWALDKGTTISHGWKPESGFLPYRWDKGYSEAIILYALALGSPTFPIEPQGYEEWFRRLNGRKSTIQSICTLDRFSSIRCLISGSIFAAFTTTSIGRSESIISRTADAPHTFTGSMEPRIQIGFLITTSLCGALRRPTDLDLPF